MKDRTIKFGMNVLPDCALCNGHSKSAMFLLTEYSYTTALLRRCSIMIPGNWPHMISLTQSPRSNYLFLYIGVTIYCVWG